MEIEALYKKRALELKKSKSIYGSSYFVIEDNKLYVMRRRDRSKSIFMIEKEKTIKLHAFRLKLRKYHRDYGYTKEGIVFLYLNYLFVFKYFSERIYEILESYSLKKEKAYRDKTFLFYSCDAYKLVYPLSFSPCRYVNALAIAQDWKLEEVEKLFFDYITRSF